MSKQIFPNELAELVTGLLVKPGLLNELDTPSKHQAFMEDIGRVVAGHCGGHVNWVNTPENPANYLGDEHCSPSLSVSPDRNLPSLNNNVWSYYDIDGWEGEAQDQDATDDGEEMSPEAIANVRSNLQGLLNASAQDESAEKALAVSNGLLCDLVNSVALDFDTEARDCLEVFDQYAWEMNENTDATRFNELKEKGNAGVMTVDELKEFVRMVSPNSQKHVFYTLILAQRLVNEYYR